MASVCFIPHTNGVFIILIYSLQIEYWC